MNVIIKAEVFPTKLGFVCCRNPSEKCMFLRMSKSDVVDDIFYFCNVAFRRISSANINKQPLSPDWCPLRNFKEDNDE